MLSCHLNEHCTLGQTVYIYTVLEHNALYVVVNTCVDNKHRMPHDFCLKLKIRKCELLYLYMLEF